MRWSAAALSILLGLASAPAQSAPARPALCGTACLTALADAFVDGLMARKAGANMPWADRVLYTENGVGITVGDGIWATVTAHDRKPLVVADPAGRSVVWIGAIEEHGQPSWLALRIKAAGNRIAEAEAIIRRKEGNPPYADPTGFQRDPAFTRAAGAKAPRARLTGLAQGYLDSIAAKDGRVLTRIAPGCERTENGLTMTSGDAPPAKLATGCEGQLKASLFRAIDGQRGMTIAAVDEARGLVVAIGMRDSAALKTSLTTTDGRAFQPQALYPRSYACAVVFKIEGGAIARIEEVTSEVPYLMPAWKAR